MLINLLGGLSLLLYGLHLSGRGLQAVAGGRLRVLLTRLTENRLMGALTGAGVTAIMQSSSATTVMLVGFVSAGFMSLEQTLGVILGADIGTTITVQIIAFDILAYSVLLIAIGTPMVLAVRQRFYNYLGQAILGFGLLFLGLKIISDSLGPLKDSPLFSELLFGLSENPVMTIVLAALLTVLIQSSAGTIALAISFASQGLVTLPLGIAVVLGANIGTTGTALMAAVGSPTESRRVALAHALYKVLGVLLLYPFLDSFAALIGFLGGNLPRQIANTHTLFNLLLVGIFLPFTGPFATLIRRLVPESPREEDEYQPRYLDEQVLSSPALALGQATREVLRQADVVQQMLGEALEVLRNGDESQIEEIVRRDDAVDRLEEAIKRYLTRISEQDLSEELSQTETGLLYVVNDLEHIGDIISKSSMPLAVKKIHNNVQFSQDGMKEIEDFHQRVYRNLEQAVAAYATQNRELGREVVRSKGEVNQLERELRQAHIQRLHQGNPQTVATSEIHLDVLNDLKRINSHATNIAYVVLGEL